MTRQHLFTAKLAPEWCGVVKIDGQEMARVDGRDKQGVCQTICGYAVQYMEETNKKTYN